MICFTLWLVRHGETLENRNNIYQGHSDTQLSDLGIEQAQLVAKRLQDIKFAHVFSSDLQRAWKTAQYILEANQYKAGLDIVKDQRLREKAYGVFERRTHAEFKELLKTLDITDPKTYVPEGGETQEQLYTRVIAFFDELCCKIAHSQLAKVDSTAESLSQGNQNEINFKPGENVLFVIHGGPIRQLISHFAQRLTCDFCGISEGTIRGLSPNTGVSRFEICLDQEGKIRQLKCVMLRDASHLKEGNEVLDTDRAY